MIGTIKQRIYLFGLLPLGALAVSLVMFNGFSRIADANRELTARSQNDRGPAYGSRARRARCRQHIGIRSGNEGCHASVPRFGMRHFDGHSAEGCDPSWALQNQ